MVMPTLICACALPMPSSSAPARSSNPCCVTSPSPVCLLLSLILVAAEAEITFDQPRIAGNFVRRSLRGDGAELHHIGIVGHLERGARVLLHQQNRNAAPGASRSGYERRRARSAAPAPGSARRASTASAAPSARGPSPASAVRRRTASRPVAAAAPSAAAAAQKSRSSVCLRSARGRAETAEQQIVLDRHVGEQFTPFRDQAETGLHAVFQRHRADRVTAESDMALRLQQVP